MKTPRAVMGLVGAVLVGLAAPVPAWAQMYEKITVVNSTGYTIAEVYIAPAVSDSWEEDVLGLDVLVDGEEVEIDFRRSENTCNWHLMVVYDDGTEAEWDGLNFCQDWHYELFYNARSGDTRLVASH